MKKIAIATVASVMFFAAGYTLAADKTFTGEIFDSQCAKMGSHEMMVKKEMPDKASMANDPMVKEMCTKNCVKMGGKYVLYDASKKTVYQLDDQTKPEQFAGKKVKVTGTYDKGTKTIHVTNIEAAS
jgi:uncharacterized protein DUF5818